MPSTNNLQEILNEFDKWCDEVKEKFDLDIPLLFRRDVKDLFIEKPIKEALEPLRKVISGLSTYTDHDLVCAYSQYHMLDDEQRAEEVEPECDCGLIKYLELYRNTNINNFLDNK